MSSKTDKEMPPVQPPVCSVCGSPSRQLNELSLLGLLECATYRCTSCGLYFRHPLPAEKDILRYYQSRCFRHADEIEKKMAEIQGNWIIRCLRENDIGLDAVHYREFGAGRGWLVSFMQKQGLRSAVGYEPDNKSATWGRETFQIDLREGFITEAMEELSAHSLPGLKMLSLVHVLEHLHAPLDVLSSLQKRNGSSCLFVEVPDAKREGPVMELDTFAQSSMGQHFWSFTEESLRILLNKAGFSIVASQEDGKPCFWNNIVKTLRIRKGMTEQCDEWKQNQFNVKHTALSLLKLSGQCFIAGGAMRMQRLLRHNYNRLDLPVIRMFAKSE